MLSLSIILFHVRRCHRSLSVYKRPPCARHPSEHREVSKWRSLSGVPRTLALNHSARAPFKCLPSPPSRPLTHCCLTPRLCLAHQLLLP